MGFANGPQAGWLIRAQATSAAGGRLAGWVDDQTIAGRQNERAKEAQIAKENPDDFPLQMAVALRNVPVNGTLTPPSQTHLHLDELSGQNERVGQAAANRLRGLIPRFSERPALHATILRYLSVWAVRLPERGEADLLSAEPRSIPSAPIKPAVNAPEALQAWEKACVAGEKMDPQNAFFPTMRAIGLFAQNRDEAAEAALLKAGRLTYFNDYTNDETRAMWHLMEQKNGGEPGAVPRLAQSVSLTFSHYALLRQLARVVTVRAMQAEIQGDVEKGFKLRHAVAHIGAVMRANGSGSVIGALVGEAVTEISYLRPGGIPASLSGNGWHEAIQTTYQAYLERTGHTDEAQFVAYENDARKQVAAIMKAAQSRPEEGGILLVYGRLTAVWAIGIALLSNALVVLLAGGAAALYRRFLSRYISGACLTHRILFGAGLVLVGGTGLFALGCYGGTLAAASLGCGLMDLISGVQNEFARTTAAFAVGAASVVGVLAPLFVWLAIRSRWTRVPVGYGIAHGLVRATLPVSAGLLVAYAGVAHWTLLEEGQLTLNQAFMVGGEGRYFAELTGKPWPGLLEEMKGTQK